MRKLLVWGTGLLVGLFGLFGLFGLGGALVISTLAPDFYWQWGDTKAFQPDVIVVLAGHPERQVYAQALVKDGLAPRLLSTLVDPACMRTGRSAKACASGVRSTVDEALWMQRVLTPERT